jgi:hypothetical protein
MVKTMSVELSEGQVYTSLYMKSLEALQRCPEWQMVIYHDDNDGNRPCISRHSIKSYLKLFPLMFFVDDHSTPLCIATCVRCWVVSAKVATLRVSEMCF